MSKVFVAGSINMDIITISDNFANELESFLRSKNVKMDFVKRALNVPSGIALIIVDAIGENRIVVVPGANGDLHPTDVQDINIAKGDILISQCEIPLDTVESFFIEGREQGAKIVFNPAPAIAGAEKIFSFADIIILNETELAFFAGTKKINIAEIASVAKKMRKDLQQTIVVTLGSEGALVLDREEQYQIPGHKVQVVDTTGAGDCFVGALAARLSQGDDLKNAVTYANAAASICVQEQGASSMPTNEEVNLVLKNNA